MRYRTSILAAFVVALALSAGALAAGLVLGLRVHGEQQNLLREDVDALLLAHRMRFRIERLVSSERAFLLTGFPEFHERLSVDPRMAEIVSSLHARLPGDRSRGLLEQVLRELDRYEVDLAALPKRKPGSAAALEVFEDTLRPRRGAIFEPLDRLIAEETSRFKDVRAEAAKRSRRVLLAEGVMAAGVVLSVLAAGFFVRGALRDLEREGRLLQDAKMELESLVSARTHRLERTIRELESIGYSVAHDLRIPARTAAAFSELVLRKAGGLDEQTRGRLRRVRDAGERLRRMLDGLVQLSRISTKAAVRSDVDVSGLARDILTNLAAAEPGRRLDARVAPGMRATGDPHLLELVLKNLLENAWTFARRRIEVGSEPREGGPAYFIRDDGPGFDPALASRLFKPFHRLPNAAGRPGLGIGLASAARAVDAHYGTIWVESRPGEGSVFYFTVGEPP